MTFHYAAFSLILIGFSGCAIGPSPQPNLPDSLTAYIDNDATGTLLMRGASLHTYASARCEGEERRANKLSMANQEALSTIPVQPGVPLTFALTSRNAQSFKGNWGCSVTSTFTPVAGARYHAVLQTEDDNQSCEVTILDQDKKVVSATKPDYSCHKTMAGYSRNGAGYVAEALNVPLYISVGR